MQLQILKIVCIKKSHLHVYAWNICLSSMYEIVLLFSIFGSLSFQPFNRWEWSASNFLF